jgi:hypothetical protein
MEWRSFNGTLMRTCDEQSVRYTDGLLSLRCDVNVTRDEGEYECRTFFTVDGVKSENHYLDYTYSKQVPLYNNICRISRVGKR